MKTLRSLFAATLTFTFTLTSFPDTTVPAQTVTTTLQVTDPGKLSTATPGPVVVDTTGKAVFIGGTSVVLSPGFWAKSGALFRASRDLNLAGLSSLIDSDNDGLPDAWEMLYFGNLTTATGLMDSDGDGVSNAAEYYAGTNPLVNEATAGLPSGAQVVVRTPTGQYQKVLTDWSITAAP